MSDTHGDRSRAARSAVTDGGRDPGRDTDVPAPSVTFEQPDRWRLVDESVETPFDAGVVSVRAHTLVYEDVDLAERVGDRDDQVWRFVFASRVGLRPRQPRSKPLTSLVTRQSRSGFADRLRDRGFVAVSDRGTRRFRVGDADATLAEYDATVRADGVTLDVDGWLAVWPDEAGDYLLAGGAYPTAVTDDGGDAARAGRLRECLSPGAFREELFEAVKSTA
jgi:hypothetical protein